MARKNVGLGRIAAVLIVAVIAINFVADNWRKIAAVTAALLFVGGLTAIVVGLVKRRKTAAGALPTGDDHVAVWRIVYQDAEGAVTQRTVRVITILRIDHGVSLRVGGFTAWCESSGGVRTFRLDRLRSAVDAERDVQVADPQAALAEMGRIAPQRLQFWAEGKAPGPMQLAAPAREGQPVAFPAARPNLLIRYRDQAGDVTERIISPRTLSAIRMADGQLVNLRVTAMCSAARAVRTFRLDRVQWAAFADTGEVIESLVDHLMRGADE